MNMYYTGLGVARSLGEHGVPVIGLTASRGVYGNFTSYAKVRLSPDSRHQPEELLVYLLELGKRLGRRCVVFPTRDDDVVFLDRFRAELEPYFALVIPAAPALQTCLDKWLTYRAAARAGVASPKSWLVETEAQLEEVAAAVAYPCVLKPVAAYHWRKGNNWSLVGGRKAIRIDSPEHIRATYADVSPADSRVLIQELIPGADACLTVAACYMDRHGEFAGGFCAQKLLQAPEGFGTGCVVRTADRPELFEPTIRLLKDIRFTGIAEVEYKWREDARAFQLIEINPRPWDQHRLGKHAGCDVIYLAYCDHADRQKPSYSRAAPPAVSPRKWVAEDALFFEVCRMLWRRDPKIREIGRILAGRRTYAIWSMKDPFPFLAFLLGKALPWIAATGLRRLWSALTRVVAGRPPVRNEGAV